jgi:hypothetical protein
MMISWWSKKVGVILNVLVCDIWINVLLLTSALVGPLHIVNWNARWNMEIEKNKKMFVRSDLPDSKFHIVGFGLYTVTKGINERKCNITYCVKR